MSTYQEVDISAVAPPLASSDQLWDGAQFIIDVNGLILTSPDGLAWSNPSTTSGSFLTFNGSLYVAVSPSSNAYTSPDLVTWTARALTDVGCNFKGVCWASALGLFVAVGSNPLNVTKIMTSPNGVTWTNRSVPAPQIGDSYYAVVWSSALGTLVAVGQSFILTSTNGTSWTAHTLPAGHEFFVDNGQSIIAWSSALGLFALPVRDTGTNESSVATSPDGATWTIRTVPRSTTHRIKGIIWAPTPAKFMALAVDTAGGVDAYVLESTDGTTWTDVNTSIAQYFLGLAWGDSAQALMAGPWGAASVLLGQSAIVPTIASVSPNYGSKSGGTVVTITGTGFTGVTSVTFGGTAGSDLSVVSDTVLTVVTPPHAIGVVSVTVGVATRTDGFTFVGVTRVSPKAGTVAGGTAVTITGFGFTAATGVLFGGTAATSVVVVSNTTITALAPAHTSGLVDVDVTGVDTGAHLYTYTLAVPQTLGKGPLLPPIPTRRQS